MIKHHKYKTDNGHYSVFSNDDVEFINPIYHITQMAIALAQEEVNDIIMYKSEYLDSLIGKFKYSNDVISNEVLKEKMRREAIHRMIQINAKKYMKDIFDATIPESLKLLLGSKSKKEQVSILKNEGITLYQLIAFICYAFGEHDFTYSQYTGEKHHKGLDVAKLPRLLHIKGDDIDMVGKTTLSKGELKQVIDARKYVIAKFIDKGDEWHCFIMTYDSLRGKEAWKGGQPHYHYISSKFGVSREEVVRQVRSGIYKLNSLPHIDLLDYD